MNLKHSEKAFKKAVKCLAGGVNSPVRAFKAVGGSPLFIKKAKGSKIYDLDNNRYVDYVMSWGAMILGHLHPAVVRSVKKTMGLGMSFGAPTENETRLAQMITGVIPSMEMIRLVNSGTEAAMSAIRLARGYTKRDKIVKFDGCYHGHCDSLLVKAGSGAATFGVSDSAGVTRSSSKDTIVLPYNDIYALKKAIKENHRAIACVIIEPVAANMGVVMPEIDFLVCLRELTAKYKIVLIFDEVISGFRFTFGGAQSLFGIKPDLTCLGKIIGGGMPLAAYGGRKEIMELLSPLGTVYQAGTLSGNPIAVSAGLATLDALSKLDYLKLNEKAIELCQVMEDSLRRNNLRFTINRAGSIFTLFFTEGKVRDFKSARNSDTRKYAVYFREMLKQGIYLAPSQFEANFPSFAHSDEDLRKTVKAFNRAVKKI
jgi:glutamate-1-semialdehyde 2,1-aminomutase